MEFRKTMITMLRALMEKVDDTLEHMGNVSRDGNPEKESKRNARDGNTIAEMEKAFDGLISTLDTLRKDSLSLRIHQQTLAKLKMKENRLKMWDRISKNHGTTTEGVTDA